MDKSELDSLLGLSEEKWNPECLAVSIRWIEAIVMLRWHKDSVKAGGYFDTPLPLKLNALLERLRRTFDQIKRDSLVSNEGVPGVFVKISTCSPKDVNSSTRETPGLSVPPVYDETSALALLCKSPRVMQDLECDVNSHCASPKSTLRIKILLKPWVHHDTRREVRCFCVRGRLRGIMQYDYISEPWDVSLLPPKRVLMAIEDEITKRLPEWGRKLPLGLESFAVDYFVNRDGNGDLVLRLVEFNPIELADDFLFSCKNSNGEATWPLELEFRHATKTALSPESDLLSLEVECTGRSSSCEPERFVHSNE